MELYLPYMVCSGALLYGFNYLYTNDTIDTIDTISIDSYDLLDDNNDNDNNNNNNNNRLEGSFIDKMDKIMYICENKCNFKIKLNNNKKKNRMKLSRFINEYNTIGYNSFIKKYKKKNI
tara:strand:- start:383 stop:739 length:357 start_codon:yes stop_codon:yes gene_type:complete